MGDFRADDLRRANGLYPHHRNARCAGCGGVIEDADRAYANFDHIWHSGCWPRVREQGTKPASEAIAREASSRHRDYLTMLMMIGGGTTLPASTDRDVEEMGAGA